MNKELKQKYKADIVIVKRLVNEFDPCGLIYGGAPDDEYDCLIQRILSRIYSKTPKQEISTYVLHEVDDHFGCPVPETHKAQFSADLDNMLDKLIKQIIK
ncbi:MAG TPA: hypothetical protein VF411_15250 [Bacteroidia bacterium]